MLLSSLKRSASMALLASTILGCSSQNKAEDNRKKEVQNVAKMMEADLLRRGGHPHDVHPVGPNKDGGWSATWSEGGHLVVGDFDKDCHLLAPPRVYDVY